LKCESHERRVKMLASARAIAGIPVLPKDLDWDAWLLNVRNGTLDLRTGTLRPHAREDLITRGIDVDYTPDAKCPTWERFLAEVFRNDAALIAFVQRAVGYSLTGDIREHVFFILFGRGSNGKSTFLDVIHALLGPYAGPVPAELLLTRRAEHHPTERATLFSKRFVATVESGDGRRLAEDRVKAITGGDPIECRRMKEDFWVFTPTHKLWFGTNHKPVIKGTDHAIWRRIRLVPFETTFHEPETGVAPQKDPTLPERLIEELPGILAWGISGCLAWQREGLKAPEAVRDATEGYRVEMDVLARFLDECCVFNTSAEARASDLYKAYTSWCETANERVESQSSFGQRLTEKGCERYRNNGIWYLGIGLRA
jgi:putative DNA primase/helicase